MNLVFKDVFISQKEYSKLCLRLFRKRQKSSFFSTILLLLVSLLAWVCFILLQDARHQVLAGESWGGVFIMFTGPAVLYSYWKAYRRNYQSTAFLQAPASYTLSEMGIEAVSPLVSSQASWQTATQLYLLPPYAILMNSSLTGYFLDFRCLEAPATQADFLALLQRHRIPVS